MSYELVYTEWPGGRLHGLLSAPRDDRPTGLVVHIHGTWGNFYGNSVVAELGKAYNSLGYKFLAANFSGHDELSIYESFEMFPETLSLWLDQFHTGGRLILQGHSLGALKLLYMNSTGELSKLGPDGLIFLSPFDSVGFYERECSVEGDLSSYLRSLVSIHGSRTIVPESVFPHWQISAETLLSATQPNGPWDQFPSRRGSVGEIGNLKYATAAILGSDDFASVPDPASAYSLIRDLPHVAARLIDGAPHNFAGAEAQASEFLAGWLSELR